MGEAKKKQDELVARLLREKEWRAKFCHDALTVGVAKGWPNTITVRV